MIPKAIPLRNEDTFRLAMRHASATTNVVTESYERLEFFGDSVLGLIIAQYLYEHHPTWDQGMLSKAKSSVVQEKPLAEVAIRLGLEEHLELSASEEATGGRKRPSILADVVEAVIGGIYLESGLELARWFVLEQLQGDLMRISSGDVNPDDYKSKLQEISQQLWRKTPQYKVVREVGSAHERRFVVQVAFDDEVIGEGSGRSKKEAEQSAAGDALAIIESHRRFQQPAEELFD
jgi:ribonuclease-3